MAALGVRGLSEAQLASLKREARRQGISVNRLVLQRLGAAEAVSSEAGEDPLLRLAGTWSQEEADAFAAAIAPLEQVELSVAPDRARHQHLCRLQAWRSGLHRGCTSCGAAAGEHRGAGGASEWLCLRGPGGAEP